MALTLMGCGALPRQAPVLLIEEAREACREPRWGGSTQGGLVLHLLDVKRALRGCKAGAEALIQYVGDTK
jgi:hypothetical protein